MTTTPGAWRSALLVATLSLGGCGLFGGIGAGDGRCGRNMDEDKFADEFFEVMCAESIGCADGSMAEMWCSPGTSTSTGSTCEFDRETACDCLAGDYTCNEDLTGFAFVEPPTACVEVFTCGGSTGSVDTD